MDNEIKSGHQIVKEFFAEIEKIEGVNKNIADVLARLYKEDKLTDANIVNDLEKLKQEKLRG